VASRYFIIDFSRSNPLSLSLAHSLFRYIFALRRWYYSGLAVKHMIDTGAGVVDADYRGPVGVVLFNFGTSDFTIDKGDRIAQLILEKISMVEAVKVEELSDTARGSGGFGSTGVKSSSIATAADDDAEKLEEDGPEKKVQRVISPTSNNTNTFMEP